MKGKDLIAMADLTSEDIWRLIRRAQELKHGSQSPLLVGKSLALLFEKPSLRTRVSFDIAMWQLGGHALYLSPSEVGLGEREDVADVAQVLSRMVSGVVARTFSHSTVELLAKHASIPVINGLSDKEHPCQALGDLLTIEEKKGRLQGVSVAFVGDGNNVAHSLAYATTLVGMQFRIASPPGYELPPAVVRHVREIAAQRGSQVLSTHDQRAAVEGADVVYTDVWTSMGQEAERVQRRVAFKDYQVNPQLMSLAHPNAILMHPLPAHHGEEVAEGVLEGTSSVVFDQAENRLHIQKAILAELLGP